MDRRFKIEGEITRQYRRFNAVGTQLTVRLKHPLDKENPVSHFLTSVNNLFENALQGDSESDMVGITIQNEVNKNDKAIGISFRHKETVIRGRELERFRKSVPVNFEIRRFR